MKKNWYIKSMENKYSSPAVFTPEENGAYSINFPDLESCYTCGDNLTDALMMGEDVLAFTLYDYEKEYCRKFFFQKYKTDKRR